MLYRSVKQKASNWTLFAFIALTSFTSPLYADNCTVSQFDETVNVDHVYDGDTIKLIDGRKLRLIGINTPERGRNGKKDEPFYQAAKNNFSKLLRKITIKLKLFLAKINVIDISDFLHIFSQWKMKI